MSLAFRMTFDPEYRRRFYDALAQRRLDDAKADLARAKVSEEAARIEREAAEIRRNCTAASGNG